MRFLKNLFSLIISIILVSAITSATLDFFNVLTPLTKDSGINFSLQNLYFFIFIATTSLTLLVAWFQLSKITKINKGDFLFRVESRYGSKEILKAREIIHKLYRETPSSDSYQKRVKEMQRQLEIIDKDKKASEKHFCLLNLLEFLESVSYYVKLDYLSEEDTTEMFGGNLIYWYDIYEQWINTKRKRRKNNDLFCEFESFAQKLKKKQMYKNFSKKDFS